MRSQEHVSLNNALHSALLFGGLILILGGSAMLTFGPRAAFLVAAVWLISMSLSPYVPHSMTLNFYRAQPLNAEDALRLQPIMDELAIRAGLKRTPRVWVMPGPVFNALTLGGRETSHIMVSEGALRRMDDVELTGILAHEVAHIKHNDVWIMGVAHKVSRLTGAMAWLGLFLVLGNAVAVFGGADVLNWAFAGLLLMAAPWVSKMVQLALSRSREFDADWTAVKLTGNPVGLRSALGKVSQQQEQIRKHFSLTGKKENAWKSSHPHTEERIKRLVNLNADPVHAMTSHGPAPEKQERRRRGRRRHEPKPGEPGYRSGHFF